jgi:hypothetical protein
VQAKGAEAALAKQAGTPVELSLWARKDVVVTGSRYQAVDRLVEENVSRARQAATNAGGSP